MALSRRKKQKTKFRPPGLMLTSMMDMFTIILIFLIFSFSENAEKIELAKDLELPKSTSQAEYAKSVKLILSKHELRLNDELMATVQGNQLEGINADEPEASVLYQRLQAIRAESGKAADQSAAEVSHVLFLCDKSHSFKTINRVIKTAGMAGYPNFQFAVLQGK